MKICRAINKIVNNINLTREEIEEVMEEIIEEKCTSAQIGGFLIGLKTKGETAEEVLGVVNALRKKMTTINCRDEYLIDTCGTGGDGANTFNISTITSIIVASVGVKVAKHGNRSISSKCGSADVLEKLNINIDLEASRSEEIIKNNGMSFLFAPKYHSAMKYVAKERRELKTRTVFNLVGPLVNPANLKGQFLGVYDEKLLKVACIVLKELGLERVMVVHGEDGLDEISINSSTNVCELKDGKIIEYKINPEEFNIKRAELDRIKGGDSNYNAEIIMDILKGKKDEKRDTVLLNAGAAIYVGKKAESIKEGIEKAKEAIDSGKALEKYYELVRETNRGA